MEPSNSKKITIIIVAALLLGIPIWFWVVVPQLTEIPKDFSYKADVFSLDNFYDEQKQEFSGEKRSVTKFSYEVTGNPSTKLGAGKDGILTVKNVFDVRTVTGDKIFAVERLYGIDPKTGKHVAGFGDKDRDGYLFAPRNLKYGAPFTYWHINYDGPAHMTFVKEENFLGLSVYHYETDFKGVQIDQTKNLTNLPGVGVTRGIELEPRLQIWVEPTTGRMVKYKDDTVAYYYDLKTGEKLNPWNHFTNSYTPESVIEQVGIAKQEKLKFTLIQFVAPALLALCAVIIILFYFRKNKIIKLLLLGILALAVLVGVGMWFVPKTHPLEKITLGTDTSILGLANWIASEKGFFREQGLDVTIKEFQTGRQSFLAMLAGEEVDISTVAHAPIVFESFERKDFSIIAEFAFSNNHLKIIARKDRNINIPSDLVGKKVGLPFKTTADFFLSLFLVDNNVSPVHVEKINTKPGDLITALQNGTVDAISIWEPFPTRAKNLLGDNVIEFANPGLFRDTFNYLATNDFISVHGKTIERFLRAMDQADAFIKKYPDQAKSIFSKQLKLNKNEAEIATSEYYTHELSLRQSALISLEAQARWAIANKLTDKTVVPNYIDFMYTDALRKVKLDAVTLY